MLEAGLILLKTSLSSPTLSVTLLLKTSILTWAVDRNGRPRIKGTSSSLEFLRSYRLPGIFTPRASFKSSQEHSHGVAREGTVLENIKINLAYVAVDEADFVFVLEDLLFRIDASGVCRMDVLGMACEMCRPPS
ncbi:hypothetical protein Tco_1154587 [Tanacetum coccineum]